MLIKVAWCSLFWPSNYAWSKTGVGSVGSKRGAGLRWESSAPKDEPNAGNIAQTFTYQQLANATKNFRKESLIGQGGFGAVYKGQLESTGQVYSSLPVQFPAWNFFLHISQFPS